VPSSIVIVVVAGVGASACADVARIIITTTGNDWIARAMNE
jgi:hypothetical protein